MKEGEVMKKVIKVEGMSCDHCVKRITNAINEIEGAKCLNISLGHKTVEVQCDNEDTLSKIEASITDAGYEVVNNE
jgi:copper ion binding protein